MRVSTYLRNKGLFVMGMLMGLRDAILGFAFMFNVNGIDATMLYQNFDALLPGAGGAIVGVIFFTVGMFVLMCSWMEKQHWARQGLKAQALIWLFSMLSYFLNGQFILGLMLGMFFCLSAAYLAMRHKWG